MIGIIDYGLGNLHSIRQVCEYLGFDSVITYSRTKLDNTDILILPGVGAFPNAMEELEKRKLVEFIRAQAHNKKPIIGICLGMQLLMSESTEFGITKGLGLIPGTSKSFKTKDENMLVPQIGWNKIFKSSNDSKWSNTPLNGIKNGEYMYFVHSFFVEPKNPQNILSITNYSGFDFCSAVQEKNIFGFQFHPERSGKQGIGIYDNIFRQFCNKVD